MLLDNIYKNLMKDKIKQILREWYDDEYYDKPSTPTFNINDLNDVTELYVNLQDGIEDIRDHYPSEVVNILEAWITETDNFNWVWNDEGKKEFPSAELLQKYLIEQFNTPNETHRSSHPEEPYLRGYEPGA